MHTVCMSDRGKCFVHMDLRNPENKSHELYYNFIDNAMFVTRNSNKLRVTLKLYPML